MPDASLVGWQLELWSGKDPGLGAQGAPLDPMRGRLAGRRVVRILGDMTFDNVVDQLGENEPGEGAPSRNVLALAGDVRIWITRLDRLAMGTSNGMNKLALQRDVD